MLLAASGPSPLWYLDRGSGVVCLLLLTASVVLGVLDQVRFTSRRWPRFVVDGLHRNVSLLVLAVLAVHIVTAVLDPFAPLGLSDAVIPFKSDYRPLWIGFGALAFDLLVALVLTSVLRARVGHRVWRAVHWLAYACWPVAVLHGIGAGTDVSDGWMLVLTAGSILAVIGAVAWRLGASSDAPGSSRGLAAGAVAVAAVALATWMQSGSGPLTKGWAGRAGTPAKLLASGKPRPARAAP